MNNLKQLFEEHNYQTWINSLGEGFNNPIYQDLGIAVDTLDRGHKKLELTTFPDKVEFWRFGSMDVDADLAGGVTRILAQDQLKGEEVLIQDSDQELWSKTGVVDLYRVFEQNYFDDQKLDRFRPYQPLINLSYIAESGGSPIHELIFCLHLLHRLRDNIQSSDEVLILTSIDSLFFLQAAKLRALRFILESLQEKGLMPNFKILVQRDHSRLTHFEATTNMLRNVTTASCGMIAGADVILLDSFKPVFEPNEVSLLHRQSRNTFHVLHEESLLNQVQDPAYGSYAIENLSFGLIKESFSSFLKNKEQEFASWVEELSQEVEKVAFEKQFKVESMQPVIVGVNNYSDPEEVVSEFKYGQGSKIFPLRSPHKRIEELRTRSHQKSIKIALWAFGDPARLAARINFAKNFFEVLGKPVEVQVGELMAHEFKTQTENILVVCAEDKDYQSIFGKIKRPSIPTFIVSKEVSLPGVENIFQGKNLVETFEKILLEIDS